MSDINQNSSTKSTPEIRIVRLNTDRTRRTLGSTTVYQVYFELSVTPSWAWRDIFGREWKNLKPEAGCGHRREISCDALSTSRDRCDTSACLEKGS